MKKSFPVTIVATPKLSYTGQEGESRYYIDIIPDRYRWLIGSEHIKLEETEVEAEVREISEQELVQKAVETLKEKQEIVRAEKYQELQEIEEQIQSLLVLTHQENPDD